MAVISGQSVTAEFTTRNFATGGRQNADSLPTAVLAVNGVDNGAAVTVTLVTTNGSVGRYKFQVTLPALSLGDITEVWVTAIMNGVTDNAVVWRDTRQDAAVSDLATNYALASGVNVTQVAGSTSAANNHQSILLKVYVGTVTGSPTTTTFVDTAQTGGDDGWWNGRILIVGGSLQGQGTPIVGWNHTTQTYTLKALTRAPTIGDPYVIV